MHIAAVRGEYKIIKLLMLFGASPFVYTYDDQLTPLDYARESGKPESLNVLKPLFDEGKKSKNNIFQNNEQVFYIYLHEKNFKNVFQKTY